MSPCHAELEKSLNGTTNTMIAEITQHQNSNYSEVESLTSVRVLLISGKQRK